jgi:17beta-estradiol 17-dehydrogenase / very-long-chain 3-oxoacyl-CoA reductase
MQNFQFKISNYLRARAIYLLSNKYNIINNWAIVTGCTSGIGKSYAEILSRNGMNLILISRNEEKLKSLQENLKALNDNFESIIIPWDFAREDIYSNENLKKHVEIFSRLNIRLLINNVGESSLGGDFINEDLEKTKSIIKVNVFSNIFMTKLFTRSQIIYNKNNTSNNKTEFQRGIINISSYFGRRAVPGTSTYSSSKAFISNFSESLHYELSSVKELKINILSLEPLFVKTKMVRKWNDRIFVIHPEKVVYSSFRKLGTRIHSYGYWNHSIQSFMLNLLPNFIFFKITPTNFKTQAYKLIRRRRKQ